MVDNGSTDGSAEAVANRFPTVKIITLPQNEGVHGYNVGVSSAKGQIVFLVDNDMDLMQSNTMDTIASCFDQNPELGVVALQVRDQSRINLSPNNPKHWASEGNDRAGYPCSTFDGGGVAIRRDVLQKTGLYLREFFVYHSEVDLSTRIWDAGYQIRYFPSIAVSHRESPVSRNVALQTFYSTRNYLWYLWIYYPGSMMIFESLHFLQRSFIANLRNNKPVSAWLKGLISAVTGWRSISHYRKPARRETIEWMQKLRDEDRARKLRSTTES